MNRLRKERQDNNYRVEEGRRALRKDTATAVEGSVGSGNGGAGGSGGLAEEAKDQDISAASSCGIEDGFHGSDDGLAEALAAVAAFEAVERSSPPKRRAGKAEHEDSDEDDNDWLRRLQPRLLDQGDDFFNGTGSGSRHGWFPAASVVCSGEAEFCREPTLHLLDCLQLGELAGRAAGRTR